MQQVGDECARAVRIFEYRRIRLIEQQEQWLANARNSLTERTKKILPARDGKLRKDREQLASLESEHEAELVGIQAQQISVSGKMWSASIVVGK